MKSGSERCSLSRKLGYILKVPNFVFSSCLDRKSCANIEDHVDESAYNAAAFYWDAKLNAKV